MTYRENRKYPFDTFRQGSNFTRETWPILMHRRWNLRCVNLVLDDALWFDIIAIWENCIFVATVLSVTGSRVARPASSSPEEYWRLARETAVKMAFVFFIHDWLWLFDLHSHWCGDVSLVSAVTVCLWGALVASDRGDVYVCRGPTDWSPTYQATRAQRTSGCNQS